MAAKLVQGGLISPPSACLTAMAAKLREQRSGLLAAAAAHGATRLARVTTAFSTRPGWHDWGVGIAYAVAQRADCTRRRVGAVVFDEANRILATGYNGACLAIAAASVAWFELLKLAFGHKLRRSLQKHR